MPLFKASDELTSKPAWLSAADQLTCFGADAAETGPSGLVMHQGWTVPAGGNGNVLAQRETIACVNMTSDIDSDIDFSAEIAGDTGLQSGETLQWTDRPDSSYGLNQWGGVASPVTPWWVPWVTSNGYNNNAPILIFKGSDWYEVSTSDDSNVGNESNIWDQFDDTLNYRIALMAPGGPWPNGMPFKMKISGMDDGNMYMAHGIYSATDITINMRMTDYVVGYWSSWDGHQSPSFQFYQDHAADNAEGAAITGQLDYNANILDDFEEANNYEYSYWAWQIIMP